MAAIQKKKKERQNKRKINGMQLDWQYILPVWCYHLPQLINSLLLKWCIGINVGLAILYGMETIPLFFIHPFSWMANGIQQLSLIIIIHGRYPWITAAVLIKVRHRQCKSKSKYKYHPKHQYHWREWMEVLFHFICLIYILGKRKKKLVQTNCLLLRK